MTTIDRVRNWVALAIRCYFDDNLENVKTRKTVGDFDYRQICSHF